MPQRHLGAAVKDLSRIEIISDQSDSDDTSDDDDPVKGVVRGLEDISSAEEDTPAGNGVENNAEVYNDIHCIYK
jgi:hypothetical protein